MDPKYLEDFPLKTRDELNKWTVSAKNTQERDKILKFLEGFELKSYGKGCTTRLDAILSTDLLKQLSFSKEIRNNAFILLVKRKYAANFLNVSPVNNLN